jgi:hypothetical protein
MTAPMANGRKPRTGPKALLLATGAATLFFLVMSWAILARPGDQSGFGFVLILFAFFWAGLTLVFWLALWTGFEWRRLRALQQRAAGLAVISALASVIGLGAMLKIVAMTFPGYFYAAHEAYGTRREASRDFTTPWGARMLAVTYTYHAPALSGRTVWVAEAELSRGEYARIVGRSVPGDPALPVTALTEAQVAELLDSANRAAAETPVAGVFRLPGYQELLAVSGHGPTKRTHRCDAALIPTTGPPPNDLGFRGTTDNASEIVVNEYIWGRRTHCATIGGVHPHCDADGTKFIEYRHCTDGEPTKVFGDPLVGVRLLYAEAKDAPR